MATAVCYTPQGSVYAMSLGQSSSYNGFNLSESFNSRLQPNEIKAGTALDITYNFVDPVTLKNAGHVYGITNNLNSSRSQAFTYDQLNRIISAGTTATTGSYCWGYQYSYDVWGNLLSQAAWTPTYGACTETNMGTVSADGNNHLSAFSYDASGNTLGDGIYTYTWNGESQLKTAGGVTYTYDGDGRRASKVGNKLYWYGSGGEILSETDSAGNTQNEYVFFGGKRIAMVPATGSVLFYAEDSLGSSRVVVQSNGTLCYDADFTPYGAERAYTNSCTQNYKFEGKERDTETQNDDFGAREYSWRFGRWLSSDWSAVPIPVPYANLTNPQTLNLYTMVADDPETSADLDGHVEWAPPLHFSAGETINIGAATAEAAGGGGGMPGTLYSSTLVTESMQQAAQSTSSNAGQGAGAAAHTTESSQNQPQTKKLTAEDVSKAMKAYDSDKDDKNPGRVVKALDTMGKDFTVSGDTLKQGVKDSGVKLPGGADKVLANVDSITRTGNNVVITNKDSITIMVLGQVGKTISFTINETVKGKSGYQGPALQNLKGVGIGIGRAARHPDHWGPE